MKALDLFCGAGGASMGIHRKAMGIDWMTRGELSEAIPPAYAELLVGQIAHNLKVKAA